MFCLQLTKPALDLHWNVKEYSKDDMHFVREGSPKEKGKQKQKK